MKSLLRAEGVTVRFEAPGGAFDARRTLTALDEVSLSLTEGRTLGLVGESGSGKSTLGRALLGLQRPSAGRVLYRDEALASKSPEALRRLRRELQLVFQDPYASLHPRRTVGAQVVEPLEVHRPELSRAEREAKVAQLLERVGLGPAHAARLPRELSGGQRQRVVIARALIAEPKVVVADEPVSALDVSIQAQLLNLLLELTSGGGLTLLLISHDLKVVRRLCAEVAVLYLGRVVEQAPTPDLFAAPRHPYTHALLSAVPRVGVPVKERVVLQGELPTPLDVPTGCAFHPRCPRYAALGEPDRQRCRTQRPALEGAPRAVACHFPLGE
ncbi:MAG: ATP-binding cassette domain-containing protein [Myxococcaceae bacterium]|nr:ATP-binding cassette domain-containing protein [Myxococcaceae bacterium]